MKTTCRWSQIRLSSCGSSPIIHKWAQKPNVKIVSVLWQPPSAESSSDQWVVIFKRLRQWVKSVSTLLEQIWRVFETRPTKTESTGFGSAQIFYRKEPINDQLGLYAGPVFLKRLQSFITIALFRLMLSILILFAEVNSAPCSQCRTQQWLFTAVTSFVIDESVVSLDNTEITGQLLTWSHKALAASKSLGASLVRHGMLLIFAKYMSSFWIY